MFGSASVVLVPYNIYMRWNVIDDNSERAPHTFFFINDSYIIVFRYQENNGITYTETKTKTENYNPF